jgi:hypothetical protein
MWKPGADALQLIGLGLNVLATAIVFLFAYPPTNERMRSLFIWITRFALLILFCGFVLQFIAAYQR